MAGHSRPKHGVADARLCPAIPVFPAEWTGRRAALACGPRSSGLKTAKTTPCTVRMSLFSPAFFCADSGQEICKMLRHRGPNLIPLPHDRTAAPFGARPVQLRTEEGRQVGVREEGELRFSSASLAVRVLNGWVERSGRFCLGVGNWENCNSQLPHHNQ